MNWLRVTRVYWFRISAALGLPTFFSVFAHVIQYCHEENRDIFSIDLPTLDIPVFDAGCVCDGVFRNA